jgi:RNA polymerase sigma factor (sigma-70 family)
MVVEPHPDASLLVLEWFQNDPDDPQVWKRFLERYVPPIRGWCANWGVEGSEAEELASEVLVRLFAAFRKFPYDPSGNFRAWVTRVSRTVWREIVAARRDNPGQTSGPIDEAFRLRDAQADLEQRVERGFDNEFLELAMRRLKAQTDPVQWEVYMLTMFEVLPGGEVARRLGISVGDVFVAKHHIRKAVEDEVKKLKNEPP